MPSKRGNRGTSAYTAPGMRRVRLLLWKLYNGTPLRVGIDEEVERTVASACKLDWATYCRLKQTYSDLWQKAAAKRERAQAVGHFPQQPWQLRRYRKVLAPARATVRKERPRFAEWAAKKLARSRRYKQEWRRREVVDRLFARLIGL